MLAKSRGLFDRRNRGSKLNNSRQWCALLGSLNGVIGMKAAANVKTKVRFTGLISTRALAPNKNSVWLIQAPAQASIRAGMRCSRERIRGCGAGGGVQGDLARRGSALRPLFRAF